MCSHRDETLVPEPPCSPADCSARTPLRFSDRTDVPGEVRTLELERPTDHGRCGNSEGSQDPRRFRSFDWYYDVI
jgi:hypothetical protein